MLTAATSPNLPSQYNPDLDMIQCTCCEDFFHAACIGATNEELPYLSNLGFVCMEVRRRMASFQHAPLQCHHLRHSTARSAQSTRCEHPPIAVCHGKGGCRRPAGHVQEVSAEGWICAATTMAT